MAIFLQGDLSAIVWDAKLKKPKFAFLKKRLKTDSKSLIKILIDYGYERIDDEKIVKEKKKNVKREVVKTLDGNEIGMTTTSSGKKNKRIRLKGEESK